MKEHRAALLLMGVVAGYLGAIPSLIGMAGVMVAAFLLPIMLWLYTLVFAFSSLWFIHYCLAALEQHRAAQLAQPVMPAKEITHA